MPPQTKKKSSTGSIVFFVVVLFTALNLYRGIFDDTYSGRQAFFGIASIVVIGFAIYAISTAFEGNSDKSR